MRSLMLGVLGVLLTVAGCDANQYGNLAALKYGDQSHPAMRGSPIEELRKPCGDGELTDAGAVVRRRPYLQQVTTSSATIGWVTVAPDGERAIVTTPDGTLVNTGMGVVPHARRRGAGEQQMWAKITGLEPDTIYCYELANGPPLTARTGFRTAPTADSPRPIRFMAFGDSGGGGSDQRELRDQMLDHPFDLIIHTGDIAYDSGSILQFEDNVFAVYTELLRNIPLYPSAGNHEYRTLQGAPFREVFALPGDAAVKYYSYDWGRIHFVALDTEASYSKQAKWLEADLAKTKRPWKIVYFHRPPYSSGFHGSDLRLRKLLAPVLEKHGVQLVLAGHDHDYERMYPQNGVAYVVTGGGGVGTYPVAGARFTAFSEQVIHFVTVEVGVDQLVLHAIDGTGIEFDSMVVPRVRTSPPLVSRR